MPDLALPLGAVFFVALDARDSGFWWFWTCLYISRTMLIPEAEVNDMRAENRDSHTAKPKP